MSLENQGIQLFTLLRVIHGTAVICERVYHFADARFSRQRIGKDGLQKGAVSPFPAYGDDGSQVAFYIIRCTVVFGGYRRIQPGTD